MASILTHPSELGMIPAPGNYQPGPVVFQVGHGYDAKRALQWRINWLRDTTPMAPIHLLAANDEMADRITQNLRNNGHVVNHWLLPKGRPIAAEIAAKVDADWCFIYALPHKMADAITEARQTAGVTTAQVFLFDHEDNEVPFG